MSIQQPVISDKLINPDHSLSHRVFANDNGSPVKSVVVDAAGNTGINTETPNSTMQVDGSLATGYKAKTANYTIDDTDGTINCTANSFDVTLPTAVGITGREYTIINSGTGSITLKCSGTEKIANELTRTIGLQYNAMTVVSDGADWQISKSYIEPYVAHGTYTDDSTHTLTSTTVPWPISFSTTENENGITHDIANHAVTISNATPAVIGWTGHGLYVDSSVIFSVVGGTLPTGITAGTLYYIIPAGYGVDSFQISAIPGGAAINTSSAGSGTFYAKNLSVFQIKSIGDYEFIFSAMCDCTSGNGTTMDIWFRRNGVNVDRSNTRVQIATAANIVISITPFIADLELDDKIELFWVGSSVNNQILYIAAQTNPTRPVTPSIILTIKKISR